MTALRRIYCVNSADDRNTKMPILDGLSATRQIRQKELQGDGLLGLAVTNGQRASKRLPILAITANVRQEQIKAALNAGSVCPLVQSGSTS